MGFVFDLNEFAFKPDFIASLCLTDVHTAEELDKVLIAHPESTIVGFQRRVEDLFDVWSPEGTSSAPCTVPLEVTPQVSQVNKFVAVDLSYL